MLTYYQQWPSVPVYAKNPKTGDMQCPPGTYAMPLYNRKDSPVRCVMSNAMEFAQWVTQSTERVPTTDVGPIPKYADKYADLHGFGAVEKRDWKDYALLAVTTVGVIAGVYWITERAK